METYDACNQAYSDGYEEGYKKGYESGYRKGKRETKEEIKKLKSDLDWLQEKVTKLMNEEQTNE